MLGENDAALKCLFLKQQSCQTKVVARFLKPFDMEDHCYANSDVDVNFGSAQGHIQLQYYQILDTHVVY